jgi:hypothetical protein
MDLDCADQAMISTMLLLWAEMNYRMQTLGEMQISPTNDWMMH